MPGYVANAEDSDVKVGVLPREGQHRVCSYHLLAVCSATLLTPVSTPTLLVRDKSPLSVCLYHPMADTGEGLRFMKHEQIETSSGDPEQRIFRGKPTSHAC